MRLSRVTAILFKAMPWWVRIVIYRLKFIGIKIHHSVEIEQHGSFVYSYGCVIARGTNIVIHLDGRLRLSPSVYLGRNVEVGADNVEIGSDTSVQDRCILLGSIKIGNGCILAPNIFIASGGHHFDLKPYLTIREQDAIGIKSVKHKPVVIEDDCWLGINVVVMPGVVIGKGSIVGAGSVVTKSIPPYSVCVGSPAKVIKKRLEFMPPVELSPSNELCLPYYYAGFRFSCDREIRRVYVCGSEFSFALDLKEARIAEVLFVNHAKTNISILQEDGTAHVLAEGDNAIYCNVNKKIVKDGGLSFCVKNGLQSFDELEVLTVRAIK